MILQGNFLAKYFDSIAVFQIQRTHINTEPQILCVLSTRGIPSCKSSSLSLSLFSLLP